MPLIPLMDILVDMLIGAVEVGITTATDALMEPLDPMSIFVILADVNRCLSVNVFPMIMRFSKKENEVDGDDRLERSYKYFIKSDILVSYLPTLEPSYD